MILAFVIGLVFGSFLNVVVYRLNPALKLKGGVFGRSVCLHCKTQLRWYDLIPIFSFFLLKRQCRYCGGKVSWQYPIVEILSGLIWVGVFYKIFNDNFSPFGGSPAGGQFFPTFQSGSSISQPRLSGGEIGTIFNFLYYVFIFSALLVIAIYDFKWKIIPDKIVYPAIAVILVFNLFEISKYQNITIFFWSLLIAIIAFSFFFVIYFSSSGRTMGLGDAKLAFLIGIFLSPLLAITAFTLAFIIGAAFGIIAIWLGKKTLKSQMAFGPFLVLGVTVAFFFSSFILKIFQP